MRSDRCMKEVWCDGVFRVRQCSRKIWKDGYCKQHHPETVAQREEESERKQQERRERDPLVVARKRIAALEAEKDKLRAEIEAVEALSDFRFDENSALKAENERLRDIVDRFIEWNEKYPSSRVYSYSAIKEIIKVVDAIFEDAKALRGEKP